MQLLFNCLIDLNEVQMFEPITHYFTERGYNPAIRIYFKGRDKPLEISGSCLFYSDALKALNEAKAIITELVSKIT